MRKKIDYIAIALILLLGLLHTIMTPVFYKTFDLNAIWFAGTGLAFVFLGVINIARVKTPEILIKRLCLTVNLIAVIYGVFVVIKLVKPHAYFSLIVLLFLLILSFIDLASSKND
jgi:hypothetical protein